jgi:hypothetical protein
MLLVLAVVAAACNLPKSPTSEDLASTAAAMTIQAELTRSVPLLPTVTAGFPVVTTVAPPTLAPTATRVFPTATSSCDIADFVADVTIPDGTLVPAGQAFTKTWRFKNAGTCSWTTAYSLVFSSGDQMNGPSTQALPANVNPGQTVDISVNLTGPAAAGDYTGNWKLRNASGVLYASFWVKVRVQPAPAVTTPVAQAALNAISGESGTVYEPGAKLDPSNAIAAGDTNDNVLARGFLSFDISSLAGKTITGATLDLHSCTKTLNPFTNLGGIWVSELQYALPLDQTDFDVSGTGIILLSAIPDNPLDMKAYLQTRTNEGRARFQIRLHSAAGSNRDGQADLMSCSPGQVVLRVSYQVRE